MTSRLVTAIVAIWVTAAVLITGLVVMPLALFIAGRRATLATQDEPIPLSAIERVIAVLASVASRLRIRQIGNGADDGIPKFLRRIVGGAP
jgi:hypothetical protein